LATIPTSVLGARFERVAIRFHHTLANSAKLILESSIRRDVTARDLAEHIVSTSSAMRLLDRSVSMAAAVGSLKSI